ncbi:hypothetical protein HZC30_04355, partial [Candidatus Woesearchaeota archaeon]|nr:hypothetical protein [Candidatus Woesearchaeota archaeon]
MLKRGQVTIFIILGIIVLFVVAGILFFSQRISEEKLAAEKETLAEPFTPASLNSFV